MSRYFIQAHRDESFFFIFILCTTFRYTLITNQLNRTKIFCKIFVLGYEIYSYDTKIKEVCKMYNRNKYIECERFFSIGTKSYDLEQLNINLNTIGKFKYRISDIVKRLSPATVKNIDKFDYPKFKNINNV